MSPTPTEPEGEVESELRRLWQQESETLPTLPPESLMDADPRTQAAVHWLQSACVEEELRAPVAELPEWVRRRESVRPPAWRSRPAQLTYVIGALAAAAALLALIRQAPVKLASTASTTVVGELDPPAHPTDAPEGTATIDAEPDVALDVSFDGERSIAQENRVELVKGSIRILLLQPERKTAEPLPR